MSEEIRTEIIDLLGQTERKGIVSLIDHMNSNGFFIAPCSGQYHLCIEGGLAEHSLNVYKTMVNLTYAVFGDNIDKSENGDIFFNSMVIVSLLHDLGKIGQFGKQNYIPNMVSDKKGGYIQSDKKPYEINKDLLALPHEIRSIQIASQFIELSEEENFAILHHNGMYGDLKYQLSGKEIPLQMLLHWADMWASRFIEKEN